MSLRRTTQRWIALLAVVVMSFSALAPALANAFAINNMGPAMWIELCSVQGKKRIAVDGAGVPLAGIAASDDASQGVAHLAAHCPFCPTLSTRPLPCPQRLQASFSAPEPDAY